MKIFEMIKLKKRTRIRDKFRYPGRARALDLKTKDFIGPDQTLLFIGQS